MSQGCRGMGGVFPQEAASDPVQVLARLCLVAAPAWCLLPAFPGYPQAPSAGKLLAKLSRLLVALLLGKPELVPTVTFLFVPFAEAPAWLARRRRGL